MTKKPAPQILAEGRAANFALDMLHPHFERLRDSAIARLQAAQRDGSLTIDLAISVACELNTLDDLAGKLDRSVLSARQLQEKLHNQKGA